MGTGAELSVTTLSTLNRTGLRFKEEGKIDLPLAEANLLLLGTYRSNAVLAQFEGRLPLTFSAREIQLGNQEYSGDNMAVLAISPYLDHPCCYVAVHDGIRPDTTT